MKQISGAILCFFVGSILLFFANQERNKVKELLEVGRLTEATVTSVHTRDEIDDDGNPITYYTPEFSFRDEAGNPRKVKQHFSQGNNSTYDYGERVQMLYHPDKPRLGRVNTFWQLHGVALLLGLFGGGFILFGFGALTGAVHVE